MSMIDARLQVDFPDYTLDVDLVLPGRGVTGVFGASGAGKSTLLRAIAGLERPKNSRIVIRNKVWQDDAQGTFIPTHRRALGFVFQDAALFPHLTVAQNIRYGLQRTPPEQQKIPLDYLVDLLGIGHLAERQPESLSGGEAQRVGIARALATSPRLLLMDEPLASLDRKRKMEIIPYLNRLNENLDIPILYVSHALDEIVRLADHLVLLEDGRAIASDSAGKLLTRLDLPLAHEADAAAVINGLITGRDEHFLLNTVTFEGGTITLPGPASTPGKKIRLRIQANDVSLTLQHATDTSILNILESRVIGLEETAPGLVMVALDANGARLLCRLTARSASTLALERGKRVYAQIKAAAIVD
ncbi:MAG: molybdenum ABC transporter ATP-binding protein [Burkholderiaceae bacterium]|nr:molybdenum ABC transporter ATP-binding protein [Burkholderiaceae bacterium]